MDRRAGRPPAPLEFGDDESKGRRVRCDVFLIAILESLASGSRDWSRSKDQGETDRKGRGAGAADDFRARSTFLHKFKIGDMISVEMVRE